MIRHSSHPRRGSVLLIITVMILLLSVAAVGLISLTRIDLQSSKVRNNDLILEATLRSGQQFLLSVAQLPPQEKLMFKSLSNDPEYFHRQALFLEADESEPYFSLLPTHLHDSDVAPQFGLTNESSKISLPALWAWERQTPGAGERALLELPGMTAPVAAAIMDWLDPDDQPRIGGAEAEQYLAAGLPHVPENRIPLQLERLLGVIGTRPGDWFAEERENELPLDGAEEWSYNGMDANERRPPWADFLTCHSRERNQSLSGQPRVYLNDRDLVRLHQRLTKAFSPQIADLAVLYRQYGPARGRFGKLVSQVELDFNRPPRFNFASELDLVGATIQFRDAQQNWLRIESPLTANRTGWSGQLEYLMDAVTVDPRTVIPGRIDIDSAPREVLLAIPGLDPATVDQILAFRRLPADGRLSHFHPTWLLERGVVDLPRMKSLLPLVTTRGDVYQAYIVAVLPDKPAFLRAIAVVDGSVPGGQQLYCRELRDTPLPFPWETLLPSGATDRRPKP